MKYFVTLKNLTAFATIFSGLSSGLSLSHVLESYGKRSLSFPEFHVQQTFYGGYPIAGAITLSCYLIMGIVGCIETFKGEQRVLGYLSTAILSALAYSFFVFCLIITLLRNGMKKLLQEDAKSEG